MCTAGCCGVRQIVDILTHEGGIYKDWDGDVDFSTTADTWPELLAHIQNDVGHGYVIQVWFHDEVDWQGRRYGHWTAGGELRDLVRALPDVVSLGEFQNPNSGNYIDGYQWVNVNE